MAAYHFKCFGTTRVLIKINKCISPLVPRSDSDSKVRVDCCQIWLRKIL